MQKILVLAVSFAVLGTAVANEKKADATVPMNDAKKAEMMKAWQEASTPGPEHEMLKGLAGKWKVNSKSWEAEGSKPEETTGTSTFKPIMGGRFVQQDFKGKMMGMPYEGTGMMGYNNITKKFESSWYDSMSTASMKLEGTYDKTSKTITEIGEFECPIRKKTEKMRSEMQMIDKDNFVFTMYMPDMVTGKEFKGMEQVYKRTK